MHCFVFQKTGLIYVSPHLPLVQPTTKPKQATSTIAAPPQPEVYIDSFQEDDDDSEVASTATSSTLSAAESGNTRSSRKPVIESKAAKQSPAVTKTLGRLSASISAQAAKRALAKHQPFDVIDLDDDELPDFEPVVSPPPTDCSSSASNVQIAPTADGSDNVTFSQRLGNILSDLQKVPDSMVAHVVQIAAGKLTSEQQVDLAQKLLRWNKDKIPHTEQCPCLAINNPLDGSAHDKQVASSQNNGFSNINCIL